MTATESLRLLGRLKLRGSIRRQWRRVRTFKGAVFTVFGVLLFVLWIGSLGAQIVLSRELSAETEHIPQRVAIGAVLLVLLAASGALGHRGLSIPADEIERLLSAPVSRGDLIRYRLRAASMRGLLGGIVVGLMTLRGMPHPVYAFLGVLVGMQTLPVLQQLLAIAFGGAENRIGRALSKVGKFMLPILFVSLVGLAALSFSKKRLEQLVELFGDPLTGDKLSLYEHPALIALARLFSPWSNMIGAQDFETFALWTSVCVAILLVLIEVTVRVPVDFRELSLETSANIAARIRRAGRGGGAAATRVSSHAAERRVPWFFGRGPGGAVAWHKISSILRKARGTFLVSVLVLIFVTALSVLMLSDADAPSWAGGAMVAGIGTIYLCAGLRFDFRDELDRMEVIKAWPIGSSKLFLAMLLPEVCLVSLLLSGAVLVRSMITAEFDPILIVVLALTPPTVLAWVALDNAVFLFAPVRVVPGQGGALQNVGRSVILVFLRFFVLGLVGVVGALAFVAASGATTGVLGLDAELGIVAGLVASLLTLLGLDAALVFVGGKVLARFDVARDR